MIVEDSEQRSGGAGIKWNALGLVGRQLVLLLFSVVLARILGPESYAIVAQAQIYTALTALILDQGLAAALIHREMVTRQILGAMTTVNLLLATVIGVLTIPLAPALAAFFATPELAMVLVVLAIGLLFKAVAIVPRAMLVRVLDFRSTAVADSVSPIVGGLAGLAAALLGFGYWSLVVQILVTDVVAALFLVCKAGIARPNFRFAVLADSVRYSLNIFGGNAVSFLSRNVDNILVGRFLGQASLSFYSIGYRVLLLPVQMISQTVIQVLFPALARMRSDPTAVTRATTRSLRGLAAASFPVMAVVGVSAPESVPLILGSAWAPVIPLFMILAFTGARQSITSINAPVYMATGRADVHFRFSIVAAIVQISGIVCGLPFGIIGVAWGYTIAGVLLTPFMSYLLKRFSGVGYGAQGRSVAPALHGALWAIGAYFALRFVIASPWLLLIAGCFVAFVVYAVVVLLVHRQYGRLLISDFRLVVAR